MAAEPIVIYSHKIDPQGVASLLRQMAPGLTIKGPVENWKTITLARPRRLFRRATTLSFGHDRDYYSDAEFATQIRGMMGYFSRFPQNENTARAMLLIQSFRFALTLFPAPEPDLYLGSSDERLKYVLAVVKHLDGAMFTPSALRDASGRVLYGAGGADPAAVFPAIYKQVPATPMNERPRSQGGAQADPDDPEPPSAKRVARRACALAAVAARGLLEQEDASDPGVEQTRKRVLGWVDAIGIQEELEPDEWAFLQQPLGVPPQQAIIDGVWRLEGLGVLAWALGQFELPAYDQTVVPATLLPAAGLPNVEKARQLLASPALRTRAELDRMGTHLLGIHWRLTDYRVKPKAMDFRRFADNAWFGKLPLDGINLVNNDLALEGHAIAEAPSTVVGRAMSIARERHLAINWLNGYSDVYSETDTST